MAYFGADLNLGGGTNIQAPPPNDKAVSKFTLSHTATVTEIFIFYQILVAGGAKAVIYDNTGAGGLPGAFVAQSSEVVNPTTNGVAVGYPFAGASLTAGDYWIGLWSAANVSTASCQARTGGIQFNANTYSSGGNPTNPFGASPSSANFFYPIIARYTPTLSAGTYSGELVGMDDTTLVQYPNNNIGVIQLDTNYTAGSSITSLTFFVSAAYASAKIKAVVYANDGAAGAPGTLLGSSSEVIGATIGANTISFGSPINFTGNPYIGLFTDTNLNTYRHVDAGRANYDGATSYAGGVPGSFPGSPTTTTNQPALWANGTFSTTSSVSDTEAASATDSTDATSSGMVWSVSNIEAALAAISTDLPPSAPGGGGPDGGGGPGGGPPAKPGALAAVSDDAVLFEYSYTTGTAGPYVLNGAWGAFKRLSNRFVTGDIVLYRVTDGSANTEYCTGAYDSVANTLQRSVLDSTSAGAAIDWSGRTRLMVHPLNLTIPAPTIPVCQTPPLDGQILVWSDAEQAYCPADFCTLVTACTTPPPTPGAPGNIWKLGSDYTFRYDYLSVGFVSSTVTVGPFSAGQNTSGMYTHRYFIAQIASAGNPPPTVMNVTDTFGLVWAKRTSMTGDVMIPGKTVNMEIWWADGTGMPSGATTTATATYASPATMPFMRVTEMAGVIKAATPWDTNASLPAKHAGTDSTLQCPGVSTSSSCGALMAWIVTGGNFEVPGGFSANPRNLIGNPPDWFDDVLAFSMIDTDNDYMWPDLITAGFPSAFVPTSLSNYTAVPFAIFITDDLITNPTNAPYLMIVDGIAGS